ncbi:Clr5 domain-containing protein [Aspergillus venezuelensis]
MDTRWESLKNDLERLYIIENKTLGEVRAEMASVHNLHKSEQQYTRQFEKWDFRKRKRNLKPEEWDDVYLDGVKLPIKRIKQESYRNAFVSTYDRFDSNFALPPTPEGMVICTPDLRVTDRYTVPAFLAVAQDLVPPVLVKNPLEAAIRMNNVAVARMLLERADSFVDYPVLFQTSIKPR